MEKTLARLAQRFYWLGIKAQVQKHFASCPECQLTQLKGAKGGDLCPMPIVTVPFKRIGVDIVGSLTPSSGRHEYSLVVVDHATWYPEAIPMWNRKAEMVAGELATLFTRVGFPKQVVTDQDTAFMSKTLKAMW